MTPAGALMIEHRLIERMLELLRGQRERLVAEGAGDRELIAGAADFLRAYADASHHGKEEQVLFQELQARAVDDALRTTVRELVAEHVRARELIGRVGLANEQGQVEQLAAAVGELLDLYVGHVEKEEKRFFGLAQKVFGEDELNAMLHRFCEFDRDLFHQHYRDVVGQWEAARPPT